MLKKDDVMCPKTIFAIINKNGWLVTEMRNGKIKNCNDFFWKKKLKKTVLYCVSSDFEKILFSVEVLQK